MSRVSRPAFHRWDLEPRDAIAVQREMAARVRVEPLPACPRWIAGCDAAFSRDACVAGVVLWDLESRRVVEEHVASAPLDLPYIPGLLSFREGPALLQALARLERTPDLLLFDGHGVAHPRRLGIASHLGVWLDLPSVGCAKSRLVGEHREPSPRRGSSVRLVDRGELVGRVVRTRDSVRPVFVSVGHRVDLETACRVVLRAARSTRLPEPTHRADRLVAHAKQDPARVLFS